MSDSQRIEVFGLQKWVRFEVCFGFTIRDFFFFFPLWYMSFLFYVSKLGNTSKCYPLKLQQHLSSLDSPLLYFLASALHFYKFKIFPPLWWVVTKALAMGPSGPAFSVP